MTYCLKNDVAAGTHVSAVRSASKRRPYLSKSSTGILRNRATGSSGPKKFCISMLTSGAKKDTWHGASSPAKAITPRRGQFDGPADRDILHVGGEPSRTILGTAPSPSDAAVRRARLPERPAEARAHGGAPGFATSCAVAGPARWPTSLAAPVAPPPLIATRPRFHHVIPARAAVLSGDSSLPCLIKTGAMAQRPLARFPNFDRWKASPGNVRGRRAGVPFTVAPGASHTRGVQRKMRAMASASAQNRLYQAPAEMRPDL